MRSPKTTLAQRCLIKGTPEKPRLTSSLPFGSILPYRDRTPISASFSPRKAGWTKQSNIIVGRFNWIRARRKLTTTWVLSWRGKVSSMNRLLPFGARYVAMPTSCKHTATSATRWHYKAISKRRYTAMNKLSASTPISRKRISMPDTYWPRSGAGSKRWPISPKHYGSNRITWKRNNNSARSVWNRRRSKKREDVQSEQSTMPGEILGAGMELAMDGFESVLIDM